MFTMYLLRFWTDAIQHLKMSVSIAIFRNFFYFPILYFSKEQYSDIQFPSFPAAYHFLSLARQ